MAKENNNIINNFFTTLQEWIKFDINGKWFPDAFIGVMSNMQRFKNGEDDKLITSIDDSIDTMAIVDSCGISSQSGGLKITYAD